MRILEYAREHADLLSAAVAQTQSRNLRNPDFVNHYYASVPWCKLYLLVSATHTVVGTLGIERMPFRVGSQRLIGGFGTNYYSLDSGAGGFLFLHWMKNCDFGIFFGGSPDAHKVIRSQRWPFFDGVQVYLLNKPYEVYDGDPMWKRAAKWAVRQATQRRIESYSRKIPQHIRNRISVQEETTYTDDLLPRHSPFEFRFTPDAAYLAWRYSTQLPFARYRLFRILLGAKTAGFVVLQERPDRLLVSHCDADDPEVLAWAVGLGILNVCCSDRVPRTVMLTCCHPAMQEIYRSFGFAFESSHSFALGSIRRGMDLPANADTSNWLVNFDWGDNGLLNIPEDPVSLGTTA